MREFYDVIVIGGGHAGVEAAWAAANALVHGWHGLPAPARQASASAPLPLREGSQPRVALVTMDPSKIGAMSCNPAIGGLAKGQIVREIDALGGLMGRATDATGIQFRMLNMSKGPAVRGPRAQCDKYAYAAEIQRLLSTHPSIDVIAATVDDLIVEASAIVGVRLPERAHIVEPDRDAIEWNLANTGLARPVYCRAEPPPHARGPGEGASSSRTPTPSPGGRAVTVRAHAVVLTTGTFMRALMHTGETKTEGGRIGEGSAIGISGMLRSLGFELGRLKTGTPPRLAAESIDWSRLDSQPGDDNPVPFSDLSPRVLPAGRFPHLPQAMCFATETTQESHDLIRANIHRAPMYSGQIDADCGPRYCPSIEDKVVRFADRDSHHVFLEPESLHTNEIYCNGISTSLPVDVQERIVHTMRGCESAVILKWGYAVEYDMVWPHQIDATGMTKRVAGLFLAGQINGTSGYEEAAGQGLVAGLNAARLAMRMHHGGPGEYGASKKSGADKRIGLEPDPVSVPSVSSVVNVFEPVILGRDQAYIGVMMDDLVTKTPREPYRMFTSRAEHRLLLRADNADERLTPLAREWGLVDDGRWQAYLVRQHEMSRLRDLLHSTRVGGKTLAELAKRTDVTLEMVSKWLGGAGHEPNGLAQQSPGQRPGLARGSEHRSPEGATQIYCEDHLATPCRAPSGLDDHAPTSTRGVAPGCAVPPIQGDSLAPPPAHALTLSLLPRLLTDIQYEGYIARQRAEIKRHARNERLQIPGELDYAAIPGLRRETREALTRFRPSTLGQAARLAGVNPADVTILAVAIRRWHENAVALS